ncbi:hypothetical protein HYT05_00450, partial [Candidatus Kaiserbacteria bacterium]|nr:hypothetical protein [Candidatus Kaiserbacteria bacterium]
MNNRSHMLGGMLIVAILAFILPFAAHTQSSGEQLPKCPEEASGVGGANQSSSNAAAGSNAQCKKGGQEGFYSGKPNKWKCSKEGKEMSNKLDAPCDYSGEGGKVKGKCFADGECKAQNPEGKPPEMPQIPKGEKEKQEQPKMPELKPGTTTPCFSGQSTSTASTTSGLFGRYGNSTDIEGRIPCTPGQSGTSTPDLNFWQWSSTTVPNASSTQGTTTAFGFQMQGESYEGGNDGTNWTGVNGWDGWIRKATSMVGIDESDIGTAGSPGSPDQARAYGSHAQFQQ